MKRRSRFLASIVIGAAVIGGSLVAAAPASAQTVTVWIIKSTLSSCTGAVEGAVRSASYSGYTNIKSYPCAKSRPGEYTGWVTYTR